MTARKYMTRKGKHIPLRGGSVAMRSADRQWASGTPALKDKQVLPDGNLFGRQLGKFGGVQGGKPIVPKTKRRGKESGFGI
jgi:hypothetical protein